MKDRILSTNFSNWMPHPHALKKASAAVLHKVLKIKPDESVLIITNPDQKTSVIAFCLYDSLQDAGARVSLIFQRPKTQLDFMEDTVQAAMEARPDIIISLSAEKMGKDKKGISKPYVHAGKKIDSIFHYLLRGVGSSRGFWSPGTTISQFSRTVPIDYEQLKADCAYLIPVLDSAESVHITTPAGSDLHIGLKNRRTFSDDGDFSRPGTGGNLPAGEVFISPELGTSEGTLVFDGSIASHSGDIIIKKPIICTVKSGFVQKVEGGQEAAQLLKSLDLGREKAEALSAEGKIPESLRNAYAQNSRNLGELGIGLNPSARITGNMLEDEKAFRTCHVAIGMNYDDDAPALIHLDGILKNPTIIADLPGGEKRIIMKSGIILKD